MVKWITLSGDMTVGFRKFQIMFQDLRVYCVNMHEYGSVYDMETKENL